MAVSSEEKTDIDGAFFLFPHPPVGAGLQHPQERSLHLKRQLADLIEKESAVVGKGEQSFPRFIGAGV